MSPDTDINNMISLLERATDTAAEGITISSMDGEDRPLIYLNKGFERLTGYSYDEAIGKNCRFLQGPDTDPEAVQIIRDAISEGVGTTVELLNYKKNGSPFWNRLSITPLKNDDGVVTHYVGVQSDITELRATKETLEEANVDLERFQERITDELEQASKVQKFIIPSELPSYSSVKFASKYEPKEQIGGDFFDITEMDKGVFGLLVADVTGHGIPAALLTFMTSFAFKNSALRTVSTSRVASVTNEKLFDKMPRGAFVTMFYAIYDDFNKTLTYTQAGHPPAYLLRKTGDIQSLESDGSIIGAFDSSVVSFGEEKVNLEPGDKLLLFSDAIVEVQNKNADMIATEDLEIFLRKNMELPINELVDLLYQFGLDYGERESYNDDCTILGMEVTV